MAYSRHFVVAKRGVCQGKRWMKERLPQTGGELSELESCAVGWDDIESIHACFIKEGQKIELAKLGGVA